MRTVDFDLKAFRLSLGLTQVALAERLGLKGSSVSRMESGKTRDYIGPVIKLLEAMGADIPKPRRRRRKSHKDGHDGTEIPTLR